MKEGIVFAIYIEHISFYKLASKLQTEAVTSKELADLGWR